MIDERYLENSGDGEYYPYFQDADQKFNSENCDIKHFAHQSEVRFL